MTTPTKIETDPRSLADWPEDSHLTDKVIEGSRESVAELLAAMAETRAARAER